MYKPRSPFSRRCGEIRYKKRKLCLIQLLFLLSLVLTCKTCPDKCLCFTQTVKCQNKDFTSIPLVPANTKFLFVTGNNISLINKDSFPTRLELLTDLYLNGNNIESVDSMTFDNLPNLVWLDLSNNKIQCFSATAFPTENKLQVFNLSNAFHSHSSMEVILSVLKNSSLLQVTNLDLSNSDLVVIPEDVFTGLSKLTTLSLQNSSILSLQKGALMVPPLLDLDLRDNSFRELPNATLAELSLKSALQLRLGGNPWRCDCFIEDLVTWLQISDQVMDVQNLTCADPNGLRHLPLLQLERSQLECNYSGDMKGVLATSYVFLGLVLALIGIIFLLVLYLNRKGIKRWIYNIRDACRDHMEGYHYRYEINTDPRLADFSINSDV